jgi:hypothetical protein
MKFSSLRARKAAAYSKEWVWSPLTLIWISNLRTCVQLPEFWYAAACFIHVAFFCQLCYKMRKSYTSFYRNYGLLVVDFYPMFNFEISFRVDLWNFHGASYTGLLKMFVDVLTTCHARCTWGISICIFLFNRTTLQIFVTYLTRALYVHPLWFYRHQHDNRVRSQTVCSMSAVMVSMAVRRHLSKLRSKRRNA